MARHRSSVRSFSFRDLNKCTVGSSACNVVVRRPGSFAKAKKSFFLAFLTVAQID